MVWPLSLLFHLWSLTSELYAHGGCRVFLPSSKIKHTSLSRVTDADQIFWKLHMHWYAMGWGTHFCVLNTMIQEHFLCVWMNGSTQFVDRNAPRGIMACLYLLRCPQYSSNRIVFPLSWWLGEWEPHVTLQMWPLSSHVPVWCLSGAHIPGLLPSLSTERSQPQWWFHFSLVNPSKTGL